MLVVGGFEPLVTDHVWVDRATGRPCRTAEILREPFARLAGQLTAGDAATTEP